MPGCPLCARGLAESMREIAFQPHLQVIVREAEKGIRESHSNLAVPLALFPILAAGVSSRGGETLVTSLAGRQARDDPSGGPV